MSIRVGTRGSALARVQAEKVCSMLASRGIETEIVVITTTNYDVRQPHLLTAKLLMEQVLAKF